MKEALNAICRRFLPEQMDGFEDAVARSLHRTAIVRISLTEPRWASASNTIPKVTRSTTHKLKICGLVTAR